MQEDSSNCYTDETRVRYHELESRVSVFSHVKENFTVSCGGMTSQHCLGKGLNSVLLPVGCEATTCGSR